MQNPTIQTLQHLKQIQSSGLKYVYNQGILVISQNNTIIFTGCLDKDEAEDTILEYLECIGI